MKNIVKTIALGISLAFLTLSFTTIDGNKKEVKTKKSKVTWKGYKVTGSHEGTIDLKSGFLTFKGKTLVGGEFVMDMTSINTTDLEGEYKGKLDGHLKSKDFFGVATYPTAGLVFTDVESSGANTYNVKADLTIKGKTNPVAFTINVKGNKATVSLKVDRTKYDIRYGSASFFDNLKDKAINDEFDLISELEF
ncbi:YceI family protein [Seonamhaeicola marinus]|uniref:YceI family protein n=1 Tax=Seonamhaeicola marinus TaxID=1912246 RepID=A0A5D0HK18_9FLAO|nr:YceI family protein [Seonamhaeicola marinus]TYA71638.1 YceI family protein [Seonamhaeicola marinus]